MYNVKKMTILKIISISNNQVKKKQENKKSKKSVHIKQQLGFSRKTNSKLTDRHACPLNDIQLLKIQQT